MTETPLCVGHVRFYENAFERFARRLAFGFDALAQETVDARPVIKLGRRAAPRALRQLFDSVRDGIEKSRLVCSLGCGGQCRAQMTDLVIHIRRVRDRMSDFIAQEPSVTLTQIVQLLFHYCLCNA